MSKADFFLTEKHRPPINELRICQDRRDKGGRHVLMDIPRGCNRQTPRRVRFLWRTPTLPAKARSMGFPMGHQFKQT